MIDVVPTILEACGIRPPEVVDGIKQSPIEGVSFAYTFDKANADAPSRHKTQYFEMMGDHAIYHEGWIASTKVIRPPWVVAGPVNPDPLNNVHLGAVRPDEGLDAVRRRCRLPSREAGGNEGAVPAPRRRKYQVLPLDASVATRLVTPRPNITAGRSRVRLHQAADRHPAGRLAAAAEHLLHHHGRHRDSRRAGPRACC